MSAETILRLVEIWLYAGGVVAAAFLTIGIDRIDEDARGAYIFRPLLVPGVLLIWPIVLWRWFVLETGRDSWVHRHLPERRSHTYIWCALALLIPLIVIAGLALRQNPPDDFAPVLIEAPR